LNRSVDNTGRLNSLSSIIRTSWRLWSRSSIRTSRK